MRYKRTRSRAQAAKTKFLRPAVGSYDGIDFQQELVKPAVIKLARGASNEIPFNDVESVSCYVEEVEEQ